VVVVPGVEVTRVVGPVVLVPVVVEVPVLVLVPVLVVVPVVVVGASQQVITGHFGLVLSTISVIK